MLALIERATKELSIPLTVGGGVSCLDDFEKLLSSGAEKVSINTAAVKNPELIREASEKFGKSCVVAAIDAKKADGGYSVLISGGQEKTNLELVKWAAICEALGAGEILLTSIDRDGTQNGYDIEMINAVTRNIKIPVIASGGCGEVHHIVDVFKETGAGAALVASLFHYGKATVSGVKMAMERNGIPCRISRD